MLPRFAKEGRSRQELQSGSLKLEIGLIIKPGSVSDTRGFNVVLRETGRIETTTRLQLRHGCDSPDIFDLLVPGDSFDEATQERLSKALMSISGKYDKASNRAFVTYGILPFPLESNHSRENLLLEGSEDEVVASAI